MHHVHLLMHGRVQGVGYRHHVRVRAQALGVRGRVRNRADGPVEVDAEGSREVLERFVAAVSEPPPAGLVHRVEVAWSEGPSRHERFAIDPTA